MTLHKLRHYREQANLSQNGIAAQMGMTQAAIAKYERVEADGTMQIPSLEKCRKLVKILNQHGAECSLDDVFPPEQE